MIRQPGPLQRQIMRVLYQANRLGVTLTCEQIAQVLADVRALAFGGPADTRSVRAALSGISLASHRPWVLRHKGRYGLTYPGIAAVRRLPPLS